MSISKTALGLFCLLAAGCNSGKPPAATREAPRVTVAHPKVMNIKDEEEYNGWLEAYKSVDIRSRVRGHITKVAFQDGDLVRKGTVLFLLDKAPFEADLVKAQAQAEALKAQEAAAIALAERNRVLIKTNAVSQQELQQSEANVKSYAGQIAAKNAEAKRIQLDLDYATITAPMDGRVGKANLVEGAMVDAGGSDPVLTTIVSNDMVYIDFNVDERTVQRFQAANTARSGGPDKLRERNMKFNFGLDTDKGYPEEGTLVFADVKYAEGTGTILVRGEAKNTNGRFVPGSRVRVRLPVSAEYSADLVPDTALNTDQKQEYLLVVGEGNIVKRLNVEPGRLRDDGDRVIVKPKLDPNLKIITEGMERARLNYPVEPIQETPQAAG